MADTNVRIKLSADGKQVREQIKLIDKDLQEIGKGTLSKNNIQTPKSDDKPATEGKKKDYSEKVSQDKRDKSIQRLTQEISLLRKEIQKEYESRKSDGGNSGSSQPSNNSTPGKSPAPNSPSPNGNTPSDNSKMGGVLGKLAAFLSAAHIFNSLNNLAKGSQEGMSKAYQTYGKTLAYTDYNLARKESSELGAPYGYDYNTVMNAGSANMNSGGFTNLSDYKQDMNSILQTSKGFGIDPLSLIHI